jgi:hypothetical protein
MLLLDCIGRSGSVTDERNADGDKRPAYNQPKLKRSEDRVSAASKVRPCNELGAAEEENKVLAVFSEWMNKRAGERIQQIYIGLLHIGEPLLMVTMIDNEIIPRWWNDFPALSVSIFNLICSLSHKNAMVPAEKWRVVFVSFFIMMRQRNPKFGSNLAKVFGLALYKWGIGKAVHRVILFLDGLSCYRSRVQFFMKDLTNAAPNATEFLKDETRFLCSTDNFNEYLSIKHQDRKAGDMQNVEECCT